MLTCEIIDELMPEIKELCTDGMYYTLEIQDGRDRSGNIKPYSTVDVHITNGVEDVYTIYARVDHFPKKTLVQYEVYGKEQEENLLRGVKLNISAFGKGKCLVERTVETGDGRYASFLPSLAYAKLMPAQMGDYEVSVLVPGMVYAHDISKTQGYENYLNNVDKHVRRDLKYLNSIKPQESAAENN